MQKRNYCTDADWVGRSDCVHCGIRDLMLFSGLPVTAFTDDLEPIDHFIFPAGKTLYHEGEDVGAVFTVRRGLIKLLSVTELGEQRIVRLAGSKSAIGLEVLDAGNTYRHTAIAAGDADVCRIPVQTIELLNVRFPILCDQIRRRLQDQLDRADEWIVNLATGPARKRVANLLLFMQQHANGHNGTFPMLGGNDMAAIIGSSPETVSRNIAALKRQGILEKVAPGYYRGDHAALAAMLR
ncbi:MAG: Crp/Fnr family transcriptional regulator [Gammaproteobacteria bacterium]|jgi:CRP-like cAMP-binding protein